MNKVQLKELSIQLRKAEEAMLKAMRASRPIKDTSFPGEKDRDAVMNGYAAYEIANFHHLERLWQIEAEQLGE